MCFSLYFFINKNYIIDVIWKYTLEYTCTCITFTSCFWIRYVTHKHVLLYIYTFINTMYMLSVCGVCRSTHDRLYPEMMWHPVLGSPPVMMCPPLWDLAYQDCYLYGYSHAADTKIDTQSICTWQINTQATVHHDSTDRWTTCTRQTNTQTAVHRDNTARWRNWPALPVSHMSHNVYYINQTIWRVSWKCKLNTLVISI